MKAPTAPGFLRRYGVLLTAAGFLSGAAAGTFIYTVEKPVFESTAHCRPLRPADDASGIAHSDWLQTEVVAMGSAECLHRVVRRLNLEHEYKMSAGEVVAELQKNLHIELMPGTTIIEIRMQGERAVECASIVNAVLEAREVMITEMLAIAHRLPRQALEARVNALTMTTNLKRAAVVAEARNQGAGGDFTGDAAVLNVNLSASTEVLREAWLEEKARLTELQTRFAALSPYPSIPLYAEILQRGSPASVPVGPLWFPRTARWTGIGTLAGLTIALALAAFRRRLSSDDPNPDVFPAPPLVPGEY